MKLTPKASLAFKLAKPASKPSFGTNVISALSPLLPAAKNTKSIYQDIPVPVTELQTLNDNLSAAIAGAHTGNHAAVAAVKDAVAAWDVAFTLVAKWVSGLAEGSDTVIREAGFVPTKSESTPKPKPGAPVEFKATINGFKGAIIAGAKTAVPHADTYVYAAVPENGVVTYDGNTMIITIGTQSIHISADTRKQTELYNLPSGIKYNVSMYAINSAGSGPATASQQVIPQ